MAGDEETEAFEATACDVGEDGSFECNIRGVSFKGNISYSQGKFVISSDEINDVWRRDDGVRRSATSFLSLNTIMRVVTDEGHIYADGRFYSPDRLRGPHRFTDLDIFTVVPELGNITKNEKGEKGKIGKGSWQKGSIFHVIDKSNNVFTSDTIKPNILICDDKDNEIADFVAIENEDTKGIALLHAKNGTGAGSLSVGNLHVVVSQAKKNLGIFDPVEELPVNLARKWNGVWKTKNKTLKRVRRPGGCPILS